MPEQNFDTPGQIKILATEPEEQGDLAERQRVKELLGQIDTALNKLENDWGGMTAGQQAELLRQIEIRELRVWQFVIRKIAPRLLG